jgi:hypothetical protein
MNLEFCRNQNLTTDSADEPNYYLDLFTKEPTDTTEGACYYNLVTPFFDSIDALHKKNEDENVRSKLDGMYQKLSNLIRFRPVI